MPRLFIAVDIPESIRRKIAWLDIPAAGVARVTPPDDLHITLHFIGEVSNSLSDALKVQLRSVTASSFVVELSGVGAFANSDRPEILWAGIVQSAELLSLRTAVGEVLKSLEIKLDQREFNPHMTVARMKRRSPVMAAEFAERNSSFHARFTATSFSLYGVAPNGQEPHYRAVEEYSLQKPDCQQRAVGEPMT
jgi:2'-5' RNA ligase